MTGSIKEFLSFNKKQTGQMGKTETASPLYRRGRNKFAPR